MTLENYILVYIYSILVPVKVNPFFLLESISNFGEMMDLKHEDHLQTWSKNGIPIFEANEIQHFFYQCLLH